MAAVVFAASLVIVIQVMDKLAVSQSQFLFEVMEISAARKYQELEHTVSNLSKARVDKARKARVAIVRPFWSGEFHRLQAEWAREYCTCAEALDAPIDLIFLYAGSRSDTSPVGNVSVEESLQSFLHMTQCQCFNKVYEMYANVDPHTKYPTAPCVQWRTLFRTLPALGYESFLMLELDVRIIRPDWLIVALPVLEEVARGKAWVIGGSYNMQCMQETNPSFNTFSETPAHSVGWWNDNHINGNAVYSLDHRFIHWLDQHGLKTSLASDEHNIPQYCRRGGYDWNIWHDSRNTPFGHMWRISALFLNCKPAGRHKLDHVTMATANLAKRFPDAVFVHASD